MSTPEGLLAQILKQNKKIVFGQTIGTDANGNCTVQSSDGSIVARSPDQISAGSAIALKTDDGQWYAVSARQTGLVRRSVLFSRRNKITLEDDNKLVYFLADDGSITYGDNDTLQLPNYIEGETNDTYGRVLPVAFNLIKDGNEIKRYGVRANIKTVRGISKIVDNTFPPTYSLIEEGDQPVFSCSVSADTNILTVLGSISLAGERIRIYPQEGGFLPIPLNEETNYLVRRSSDGNLYLTGGLTDPVVNIEESGSFLAKYSEYYGARLISPVFYSATGEGTDKITIPDYTVSIASGNREFAVGSTGFRYWYGVKDVHYVGVVDNKLFFFEWESLYVENTNNLLELLGAKDSFIKVKLHSLNLLTEEFEENIANATSSISANSGGSNSIIRFEPITIPLFGGIPAFVPIVYDGDITSIGFDFPFRIIATSNENVLIEINTGGVSGDAKPYDVVFVYRYYTGNSYIELPSSFFDFTIPEGVNISSIFFGDGLYNLQGSPIFTGMAYRKENLGIGRIEIKPDNTFILFLGVDDLVAPNVLFYTTRTLDTPWGDIEEISVDNTEIPTVGRLAQIFIDI